MFHCITQLRFSLLAVQARKICTMDTFSELLAARCGPLEHVLSLLSRIFNALMFLVPCYHHCCMFLPSLFSHSITLDEIPGHKSWKEDRTVLKPRSPKLVSFASDFLYVISFSFFGIWFLCGYTRKSWWLFRVF
jgi:hypothetical protein